MEDNASSTLSPPPPTDLFDVDDIITDAPQRPAPSRPSRSPIPARTLSSIALGRRPKPSSDSPNFLGHSFRYEGQRYTIRERSAVKRGGKASHIWQHASELVSAKHRSTSWLCTICWNKGSVVLFSLSNTSRPRAHLLEKHQIFSSDQQAVENNEAAQTASIAISVLQQQMQGAHQRPTQLTVDKTLSSVIEWIIAARSPFSCVELPEFRNMVMVLNPQLFDYIYKSGNSVRKLVLTTFQHRRMKVINDLQSAQSKIHLSFDLWSSPNSLALCGVVAHYLTADFRSQALLIGLRSVQGAHSGENIAETVLEVVQEYGIADKVGYFQADNAGNNDTCVRAVLRIIAPSASATQRRLRCYGHIINLAAKAFLFGKDPDAFEVEVDNLKKLELEVRHEEELLILWRRRGCVGKLHNIIIWIRKSSQRRDAFMELGKDDNPYMKRKWLFSILNNS
jgi:hypothetical protein